MRWYEKGSIAQLLQMDKRCIMSLDVETTGLSSTDEILQLAVVRGDGEVLVNRMFRPVAHSSWPAAQRVHGISPDSVENEQPIHVFAHEIEHVLGTADLLVGYNVSFDLAHVRRAGIRVPRVCLFDVMREFAPVLRGARGRNARWQPLWRCARYYDVRLVAHNALGDARAALECFNKMLCDDGSTYGVPGSIPYLELVKRYA